MFSKQPSTGSRSEANKHIPQVHTSPQIHLNVILPSPLRSRKLFPALRFFELKPSQKIWHLRFHEGNFDPSTGSEITTPCNAVRNRQSVHNSCCPLHCRNFLSYISCLVSLPFFFSLPLVRSSCFATAYSSNLDSWHSRGVENVGSGRGNEHLEEGKFYPSTLPHSLSVSSNFPWIG